MGDFLVSLNVFSNIALLEVLSTYTVLGSLGKDGFEQHTSTALLEVDVLHSWSVVLPKFSGKWSLKE